MNKCFKSLRLIIVFAFAISLSGCGVYSFTGASVSPDVKTFSIDLFKDQSQANPNLRQELTDKLRDKLATQTSLSAVSSDGDIKFSGTVLSYDVNPVTSTTTDIAADSRLKIVVKVDFANEFEEENNFSQNFSAFADFSRNTNFNSVEQSLVEEINELLVDEIFNKALVNW